MPPKSKNMGKLSRRELEICQRVREVRDIFKWSQPDFAKELGISRVRLASYEYGRAPIRYWFAQTLCSKFQISQMWLATGQKPINRFIEISPEVESKIPARMLFSEAYDNIIGSMVVERLKRIAREFDCSLEELGSAQFSPKHWPAVSSATGEIYSYFLTKLVLEHLSKLPKHLQFEYYDLISETSLGFLLKHRKEIEPIMKARKEI
jgi:transcriptional regulator with XRE-family HTH domain